MLNLVEVSAPPELRAPPERVVSLVPSLTESLFALGFGGSVVGITDYCRYPEGELADLPRVGGTKNPRIADVTGLQPDLVLANQEENTPRIIAALRKAGVRVWLTFPNSVDQTIDVLRQIAALYHTDAPAMQINALQMNVDWARAAAQEQSGTAYFCPVWEDTTRDGTRWWMTFNQYTYSHDMLAHAGGRNVFAERERRYPIAADLGLAEPQEPKEEWDRRYPRLTADEIITAAPEVILLPDEPYAYDEVRQQNMREAFKDTPAAQNERIYLVDGSLITWHGTRLAKALQELPQYFA